MRERQTNNLQPRETWTGVLHVYPTMLTREMHNAQIYKLKKKKILRSCGVGDDPTEALQRKTAKC